MSALARRVEAMLHDNILSFWMRMADPVRGGFYGRMTGQGELVPDAPRGGVLNARILWTFSAAYRTTGRAEYLAMATRAKDYLVAHFTDDRYGGIYWAVDADGRPLDSKKQFYALGFALYGLSEHYRATGEKDSLERAIALFEAIESHSRDPLNGGYREACARDWSPLDDVRLSDKDANEPKTMNTHLHILEPYTNLYRVWPDKRLENSLRELAGIFLERIYRPSTGHLGLFFDDGWRERGGDVSFGHDIEAAWLLLEATDALGDRELQARAIPVIRHIARAAAEGLQPDGSMIYERHADGRTDTQRHWWVQAEAVAGYMHMYARFGGGDDLQRALSCLEYIETRLVDRAGGEWWWGIAGDGTINDADDKAGFWKCPYHNGRMCMEIISLAAQM